MLDSPSGALNTCHVTHESESHLEKNVHMQPKTFKVNTIFVTKECAALNAVTQKLSLSFLPKKVPFKWIFKHLFAFLSYIQVCFH